MIKEKLKIKNGKWKIMGKLFAAVFLFLIFNFQFSTSFAAVPEFPVNYNLATGGMRTDLESFSQSIRNDFPAGGKVMPNFIPPEAKIGKFFIEALSTVARAVYGSLSPFLNAFIIAMFAFWIMMETWQMMRTDNDYWGLAIRLVKKGATIAIWLWILNNDPADIFMWIAAPVISFGSNVSDAILSGMTGLINTNMPDTCAAIREWIGTGGDMLIDGAYAADLLCMPTRIAGFFYSIVATGFEWMARGLGSSGLTFLLGLVFVIIFIYNIWKFAISALGVIVDLFFVLMFLPFTAVRECFKDKPKYDGLFLPIFNEFAGLVKGTSIDEQFRKFINAIIYFIVLSIVAAICIVLLAGVEPMVGGDFMSILIMGCLVAYLLGQVDNLAKSLTKDTIDTSFGAALAGTATKVGKNAYDWGKSAFKVISAKAAAKATAK